MTVFILQTPTERHVENVVFGGHEVGARVTLCSRWLGGRQDVRRGPFERIPAAAICPACAAVAYRWYADFHFEPFDCVQRRRLLANLDRDLVAVDG